MAGISKDTVESHRKFAHKLGLEFSLLSDPGTDCLQALGAWGEKKMYGKVVTGAIRSTFVSDGRGKLKLVYKVKRAKGHAQQVLEDLG